MKEFKVKYRSENRIKTAHVYAKSMHEAVKMVMNLMYISEEAIIA